MSDKDKFTLRPRTTFGALSPTHAERIEDYLPQPCDGATCQDERCVELRELHHAVKDAADLHRRLVESYNLKADEFAAETRRASDLAAALAAREQEVAELRAGNFPRARLLEKLREEKLQVVGELAAMQVFAKSEAEKVKDLRAKLAAAEADTRRLDWLAYRVAIDAAMRQEASDE